MVPHGKIAAWPWVKWGMNWARAMHSLCAAPWPTWQRLALLRMCRVGWVMRSGSRLSNGVMGLRELLKHPLPSRYRAHQGDNPHGEPDRFSRYRSYYTIYTSIVSYEPRRIKHKRNHRDPTALPLPTSQMTPNPHGWRTGRGAKNITSTGRSRSR